MAKSSFPSITSLFTESLESLKASFGNIVLLSLFGSIIGFVVMISTFIGVIGMGILTALSSDSKKQLNIATNIQSLMTPENIKHFVSGILLIGILATIIKTISMLGIIFAINEQKSKPTFGECLKKGFSTFIPVFLIGIVASLISFGAAFLFIIPGMIISFFLMFTTYEIVIGNKKPFEALKGSVQIASQHFGEILLRIIIYFLGTWLVVYLGSSILSHVSTGLSGFYQIIVSIFSGLYGMVFSVTLYQHARKVTISTRKPSLTWIYILSGLGWIIAILIGFQVSRIVRSPFVQDKIKTAIEAMKTSILDEKTEQQKQEAWKSAISEEARPYYDQSLDLFKQMGEQASNPTAVKKLNDQNIVALKKAIELDGNNPELWNSLSSALTWVTSKGTLKDSLDASKKSEELDPSIWSYAYQSGTVSLMLKDYEAAILKFQQVLRAEDNYGMGHISLGYAYKQTGMKDSAKSELEKGIEILTKYNAEGQFDEEILRAKKELETVDQVAPKTSTTSTVGGSTVASCTKYQIREGEFASNKCYAKKDYDDLIYYLGRYNSAAFSYNAAASSMNITCNGSDFFKSQCEQDKKELSDSQSQIDSYKATIRGIIAKGK